MKMEIISGDVTCEVRRHVEQRPIERQQRQASEAAQHNEQLFA
jgi:hypothetical protein